MQSCLLFFVFMNVRAGNPFHLIKWVGMKVPLLLYSFKVFIDTCQKLQKLVLMIYVIDLGGVIFSILLKAKHSNPTDFQNKLLTCH